MRLAAVGIVVAVFMAVAPAFAQSPPAAASPLLVQGAMDIETRSLVGRLEHATEEQVGAWSFWRGTIDGYPVIVSKTLKGVSNAAAATMIAIERFKPVAIINQGTAGGLDAGLKLFDIVLGTSAVNLGAFKSPYRAAGGGSNALDWVPLDLTAPDGEVEKNRRLARFAGDERVLVAARSAKASYTRGRIVEGAIGTSDLWNDEVDRLARFRTDHGTLVEEMETASAAQIAAQLNVPFLGIRIVSDNAIIGVAFDRKTGEACQDYVYQVVKAYIAQRP
jgi:adenosylhomocysteine nucleosidase